MSDLLKKSVAYAFAIISTVLLLFQKLYWESYIDIRDVLKQFTLGLYFRNQILCESCTYFCNCSFSVWI